MFGNSNIGHLVAEAKDGSQTAMSSLYQLHKKPMFGICIRMLGDRNDAEDSLQEAFVAAFKNIDHLKKEENFGGWLRRIVINQCVRVSTEKIRWTEISDDISEEPEESSGGWLNQVDIKTVYEAIKDLPQGYRQVFNLFAIEDYSHKEIAQVLGISESTSKSQYHKAKKFLKDRLETQFRNG